jgi:hypothetical protein
MEALIEHQLVDQANAFVILLFSLNMQQSFYIEKRYLLLLMGVCLPF